jgi:hypothetical protein
LSRAGFGHPLTGLETACGNSERESKQVIMVWMKRDHQKPWKSIPGQKYVMGVFFQVPSDKKLKNT